MTVLCKETRYLNSFLPEKKWWIINYSILFLFLFFPFLQAEGGKNKIKSSVYVSHWLKLHSRWHDFKWKNAWTSNTPHHK
jgi:hypothetical protein